MTMLFDTHAAPTPSRLSHDITTPLSSPEQASLQTDTSPTHPLSQTSSETVLPLAFPELDDFEHEADVVVAPDRSYVEASSGATARHLKLRYDHHFGVGKDIRTPYVITAFINQHGQERFRITTRDAVPPAAAAVEASERIAMTTSTTIPTSLSPARSNMPKMLGGGTNRSKQPSFAATSPPPSSTALPSTSTGGSPATRSTRGTGPRKMLRKQRSMDMLPHASSIFSHASGAADNAGGGANIGPTVPATAAPAPPTATYTGRAHSQSVTAADLPRASVSMLDESSAGARLSTGDIFGYVMQFGMAPADIMHSPAHHYYSSSSSAGYAYAYHQHHPHHYYQHQAPPYHISHPFGPGVEFESPVRKGVGSDDSGEREDDEDVFNEEDEEDDNSGTGGNLEMRMADRVNGGAEEEGDGEEVLLTIPITRTLREVGSFESVMTARATNQPPPPPPPPIIVAATDPSNNGGHGSNGDDSNNNAGNTTVDEFTTPETRAALSVIVGGDPLPDRSSSPSSLKTPQPQFQPPAQFRSSSSSSSLFRQTLDQSPNFSTSPMVNHEARAMMDTVQPKTAAFTRFSSDVFEVLQTFRGLPLPDLLFSPDALLGGAATIRLSLNADESVVPRDDPRFVIWGEVGAGAMGGSTLEAPESAAASVYASGSGAEVVSSPARSRASSRVSRRKSSKASAPGSSGAGTTMAAASAAASVSSPRLGINSPPPPPPPTPVSAPGVTSSSPSSSAPASAAARSPPTSSTLPSSLSSTSQPVPSSSSPTTTHSPEDTTRVIVGASIERWIAQLTSTMDYDELLTFLLTYRTYIDANDLLHLLIARFHWALEVPSAESNSNDNGTGTAANARVRHVVRTRTFTVLKYWLSKFFEVDFLPNRELRVHFAGWVNALLKDPILKKHKAANMEVRRLKREAQARRDMHFRSPHHRTAPSDNTATHSRAPSLSPSPPSTTTKTSMPAKHINSSAKRKPARSHVLGEKFAEAVGYGRDEDDSAQESDLDLDFEAEKGMGSNVGASGSSTNTVVVAAQQTWSTAALELLQREILNHRTTLSVVAAGPGSPPFAASVPLPSHSLHMAHHAGACYPAVGSGALGAANVGAGALGIGAPLHHHPSTVHNGHGHNTISRVIVKTLGKLGRWKRVLNSGQVAIVPLGGCANVSAFDPELNETVDDVLSVAGGPGVGGGSDVPALEGYVKVVTHELPPVSAASSAPAPPREASGAVAAPAAASMIVSSGVPAAEEADGAEVVALDSADATPTTAEDHTTPSGSNHLLHPLSVNTENGAGIGDETDAPPAPVAEMEYYDNSVYHIDFAEDSGFESNDHSVRSSAMPSPAPQLPDNLNARRISHAPSYSSSMDGSRPSSMASNSPFNPPGLSNNIPFDVISIDNISNTSSDEFYGTAGASSDAPRQPLHNPASGLRKMPKRLPNRRDFEFVNAPRESIVSIAASETSTNSVMSGGGGGGQNGPLLGQHIQQWQMNALLDSLTDDEEGDVEEALIRLEGRINPKERQEKVNKVDGWVRAIHDRLVRGDYTDEESRFPVGDDEPNDEVDGQHDRDGDERGGSSAPVEPASYDPGDGEIQRISVVSASTHGPEEADITVSVPIASSSEPALLEASSTAVPIALGTVGPSSASSPIREPGPSSPEAAVPEEILKSRLPRSSRPSTAHGSPADRKVFGHVPVASPTSNYIFGPGMPRVHRSFVMNHSSELLAQHFAMIDRELFMGVNFEELVRTDWMLTDEVHVLDWAQYLKDRATWKAEQRLAHKTSALAAVRARFNVIATFVLSEIVLTMPQQRHAVARKFIRIAWKSYAIRNYHTLVAIMTGLQSEWAKRAMGDSWKNVGLLQQRMLHDLKRFIVPEDCFKHMRESVNAIVDANPMEDPSSSQVMSTNGTEDRSFKGRSVQDTRLQLPSSCVPFIGIYLAQLQMYSKLPDLIDPTAPTEPVKIDPETSAFSPPAHPEVFSSLAPLPSYMQLEPLINVQKQRLIAGVIRSLVTGQHLASHVQYPVDKKLYQKCVKLRGLNSETLHRVYASLS